MDRGRIKQQLSKLQLNTPFGPANSLPGIYPRDAKYIYKHHYLLQHCLGWQKTEIYPNIWLAAVSPQSQASYSKALFTQSKSCLFSYAHISMCSQREKLKTLVGVSLDFYYFCQYFIVILPTHNLIALLPNCPYKILSKISSSVLIETTFFCHYISLVYATIKSIM